MVKSFGLGPKALRVRISPGVPKFKSCFLSWEQVYDELLRELEEEFIECGAER